MSRKLFFFAVEAWRHQYGDSVLQHIEDPEEEAEPVVFRRPGVDDLGLKGWLEESSSPGSGHGSG